MKRISLRILLMVLTFGLGLGSHWAVARIRSLEPKAAVQNPPKAVESRFEPVFYPVTVPAPPPVILDYDVTKFFPEGSYELTGNVPKEFREFSAFELRRENAKDTVGTIEIFTHSNDVWTNEPVAFGWVTQRRLFFVSQIVSTKAYGTRAADVVYRFEGEFLRRDPGFADEHAPVLRGRLTKMQGGRTIAERVVTFQVAVDGC